MKKKETLLVPGAAAPLELVHTLLDPPEIKYFPGRPWYDEQVEAEKKQILLHTKHN